MCLRNQTPVVALVRHYRRPSPRPDGQPRPPVIHYSADVCERVRAAAAPFVVLQIGDAPARPISAQLRAAGYAVRLFLVQQ